MSFRVLATLVFLVAITLGSSHGRKPSDPIRVDPPRPCLGCRGLD